MDKLLNPTTWVLIGVAVALIGYDIFAALDPLDNFPTITVVMQRAPALVIFLLGVVTGHLFLAHAPMIAHRVSFVRLIDYDTFWADIRVELEADFEKGDGIYKRRKIRLARVNSNEVRVKIEEAEEGYRDALTAGTICAYDCEGGKYQERIIAEVDVCLPSGELVNLSDYLLEAGLATPWRG